MKMYLTKYALSNNGKIVPVDVEPSQYGDIGPRYVYTAGPFRSQYIVGRDVFATEDEALAAANVARHNKIRSLRKQSEKLEAMTFRVVEAPAEEPAP